MLVAALLAGCGGDDDEDAERRPRQETAATTTTDGGGAGASEVGLVTDIGGLDDRSFNFLANKGLERAEEELGVEGRVVISRAERRLRPEPLAAREAGLRPRDRRRLPDGGRRRRRSRSGSRTSSFAIIDFAQAELKSKPANVRGLLFKEQEAGYLVGYLAGLVTEQEAGSRQVIGSRRRPEDPAGRPLHRRLPGGREGGEPGDRDAERVLAGLRRPGEVQGGRARPDRPRRPRDLPGRGPVRPRRALGRGGEERARHRRRRRPGLPRRARAHERAEEGRRRRLPDDPGRAGRQLRRAARTPSSTSPRAASGSARSPPTCRPTSSRR